MYKYPAIILALAFTSLSFGQHIDSVVNDNISAGRRDSLLLRVDMKLDSLFSGDSTRKFRDTLPVADSSKSREAALSPLTQRTLVADGNFIGYITRTLISHFDYRYNEEILGNVPVMFLRDLGSLGQPNEITIYGAGFNQISFMQNGLTVNNRLTNSFDMNNLQAELVDSIETLTLPRGFLYGPLNNQASINFISRENFSVNNSHVPYSKIRYYQAPNEEAMVDFIYHSYILRKLAFTFSMTNKTFGDASKPRFANSNFSCWNGSLKMNYLLSNDFNIIGSYNYVKSQTGLYGGLTERYIDSLNNRLGLNGYASTELENGADVYFTTRYQKNTARNFTLQLLGKQDPAVTTDVKAYYMSMLNEFRQNEQSGQQNVTSVTDDNRSSLYGININESINVNPFRFNLTASYETDDYKADVLLNDKKINLLSVSAVVSVRMLDNKLIPAVFGKYLNYDGKAYPGFGADVNYFLSDKIKAYAGASQFTQPSGVLEAQIVSTVSGESLNDYKNIGVLEAGLKFNDKNISAGINLFRREVKNDVLFFMDLTQPMRNQSISNYTRTSSGVQGAGFSLSYNFSRIYLEAVSTYYKNITGNFGKYTLPEFTFRGGVYYHDTLFNANLHLKTGIFVSCAGVQSSYFYDFERSIRTLGNYNSTDLSYTRTISPVLQLDFRLVAEIQQVAELYITVENLFDEQYYIVPYYIKQTRGLRIGFSWEFLN
ncbi:MAG: TonB-dependent receptor plug domain-containing protein [Ignavibacteria bacterium]